MEDIKRIREVAAAAAREAGEYALENMGKLKEILYKDGHNNLVTNADKYCEKLIVERINREFPDHDILAEESGEHIAEGVYKWVIDPIDGTTNYAHGLPVFCVSIGVVLGGEVLCGVVYDPSRDEIFEAAKGSGATLNGEAISVSTRGEIRDALTCTGFAYVDRGESRNIYNFQKMMGRAQAVRRMGSAAIDLCYVASGRFDGFWELGLCPWDTAAGQIIVTEAGGKITTDEGGPFDIFCKGVLATNGLIHDEMLQILAE